MITYKADMTSEVRNAPRGGIGDVVFTALLPQLPPNCRLLKTIRLEPGCSIGNHPHEDESEVYVVMEGELTVNDNGREYLLQPGDAHCCFPGDSHAIINNSDAIGSFLAIIIRV